MVHIGHPTAVQSLPVFASPPNIAIIEARFYDSINTMLMQGAVQTLNQASASYDIITVPGALEIPTALQILAVQNQNRRFDAFITLGCVIRGETTHYDIVANESARGIADVSLRHNLAVGNGILTVENMAQAIDRADPSRQNKGGGAAIAALTMLALKQNYKVE